MLRGLAALGALLFHFTDHLSSMNAHLRALPFRFAVGIRGVQLLFMISGFTISVTLEATRRPMDFVIASFSQLFPMPRSRLC